MCNELPAERVMEFLNSLFTRFDDMLDIYGVYKVCDDAGGGGARVLCACSSDSVRYRGRHTSQPPMALCLAGPVCVCILLAIITGGDHW